jgi:hypothetical protein
VLSAIKKLVDASAEQDKNCKHLAEWCELISGILQRTAHEKCSADKKAEKTGVDKEVEKIGKKAQAVLEDLLKLIEERQKETGLFGKFFKLARTSGFKEATTAAQEALKELLDLLQLGLTSAIRDQVNTTHADAGCLYSAVCIPQ